jgi:myo-inositol-1(or 4)-monophosphatase
MTAINDRLARAIAIVEEASISAKRFFEARNTIVTHTKRVQDFVSEADTTVETLIRDRLASAFPGEAIIGEEMGGAAASAYWIIDPIDGTSNFLRGSPLWGISLGYVRDGRPELGVVALPVFNEIFAAADGTGLLLNGKPFARTVPFEDIRIMSLGDSPSDDIDDAAALHSGLRRANWVVEAFHSTSVSLVFAARGMFDGHLQKTTTMWDIAGGAVLAREAGLEVRIGADPITNVPWIAAGTPALLGATEPLWPEIVQEHGTGSSLLNA